jgi:NADPH:quinone reductase-like Zn-dependent oxidoreductase
MWHRYSYNVRASEARVKALYFEEHGGTDKLLCGDRPEPEPGVGEVRVRLKAAALNHLDLFVLHGMPGIPIGLPHVGGADGAGTVDAVGEGVDGVEFGSEVVFDPGLSCGRCEYCLTGEQSLCITFGVLGEHADGTFAEAVVVAADSLAPRPSHLSWEESAAFGLAHLTAWRMLINRGGLRPGETVLIHGIGGGVSMACLQLAKLVGARVIVTSRSEEKLCRAAELGAGQARRRCGRRFGWRGDLGAVIEGGGQGGADRDLRRHIGAQSGGRDAAGILEPAQHHRFDHGLPRGLAAIGGGGRHAPTQTRDRRSPAVGRRSGGVRTDGAGGTIC